MVLNELDVVTDVLYVVTGMLDVNICVVCCSNKCVGCYGIVILLNELDVVSGTLCEMSGTLYQELFLLYVVCCVWDETSCTLGGGMDQWLSYFVYRM